MRETESTNPQRVELIRFLKRQSREKNAGIWLDIAENLAKPKTLRVAVNLSKISRNTQKRDVIIVPGKVLGTGNLSHPLTIAAFDVSDKAEQKLKGAKAKFLSIPELVEKNPTGANVKIIR
jgi:large subunit ribosomal protein L18e